MIRILLYLLTVSVMVAVAAAVRPWGSIPPHWNPWHPLALDHQLTVVTRWKLQQLNEAPDACLRTLKTAASGTLDYLPLDDYIPVEGCPLENVVRVSAGGARFNTPFTTSCPLLVRWAMFEQQALQPLAARHLGSAVETVEHFGSFSCRNIYNRENDRRSEHATASALDVAGFTLTGGEKVTVLRDWKNADSQEKQDFLRATHKAACSYFGTVLGPDYNEAHHNHFHLDTKPFGLCR